MYPKHRYSYGIAIREWERDGLMTRSHNRVFFFQLCILESPGVLSYQNNTEVKGDCLFTLFGRKIKVKILVIIKQTGKYKETRYITWVL